MDAAAEEYHTSTCAALQVLVLGLFEFATWKDKLLPLYDKGAPGSKKKTRVDFFLG